MSGGVKFDCPTVAVSLNVLQRIEDLAFMIRRKPVSDIPEVAAELEKLAGGLVDRNAVHLDEIKRLGT